MINKFDIQKLRELDILQVADLLGMGLRNKRALCIHHDDHHPSLAFNVKKNTCHRQYTHQNDLPTNDKPR